DSAKQKDAVKQTYAQLPEGTRQEIMDKVNAAMVMDQHDDAIRLMEKLWKQNKADVEVVRAYIKVARAQGDLDRAARVAKEALAADPKNETLQGYVRRTADTSPEALPKIRREE